PSAARPFTSFDAVAVGAVRGPGDCRKNTKAGRRCPAPRVRRPDTARRTEVQAATQRTPPSFTTRRICSIAAVTRAGVRPFTTTDAPSVARAVATTKPIPAVESVTTAVLPASPRFSASLLPDHRGGRTLQTSGSAGALHTRLCLDRVIFPSPSSQDLLHGDRQV